MVEFPTLRTVCGPSGLAAILDAVSAAWESSTWVPEHIRKQVEIAVAEIAANIVEHAGKSQAVTMLMEMRVLPDRVEIDFSDDGVPAQIDIDAVQMPGELAERGRGLAMAKSVLGQLIYHYNELGNRWTLISRTFSDVVSR